MAEWLGLIDRYGFPLVTLLAIYFVFGPLVRKLGEKHIEAIGALTESSRLTAESSRATAAAVMRLGELIGNLGGQSLEAHRETHRRLDAITKSRSGGQWGT